LTGFKNHQVRSIIKKAIKNFLLPESHFTQGETCSVWSAAKPARDAEETCP
jgi:hypothetical protein